LTISTCPAKRAASRSTTGAIALQGLHQVAESQLAPAVVCRVAQSTSKQSLIDVPLLSLNEQRRALSSQAVERVQTASISLNYDLLEGCLKGLLD
jgi:hypothetical protein